MVQNADSFQDVTSNLDLAREVGRVGKNLLALGGELHGILSASVLHGGFDTNRL